MYIMNNKSKHYIKDFKRKLVSGDILPMYANSLSRAYDFDDKEEALFYLSNIKDFDINDWKFVED